MTNSRVAAIKPPSAGQQEHPDHKIKGLRLRVGAGGTKSWILRRQLGATLLNRKLGTYPVMGLEAARTAAGKMLEAIERDGDTQSLERTSWCRRRNLG